MPPKKNKNQTKVNKKNVKATAGKKKKNNTTKSTRNAPPKNTAAKTKGNPLKKTEQMSASDKSVEMNITVVWNKNGESSNECLKPVAAKNNGKTSKSNKKSDEKKETRSKTKQSTDKDVKAIIPIKTKVIQVRNCRKRSTAESAAEESKTKKLQKSCEKGTQVTQVMIDEDSSGQASDIITENKQINYHGSDEFGSNLKQETHEFPLKFYEIKNNNQAISELFDGGENIIPDDIIVISSDEEY